MTATTKYRVVPNGRYSTGSLTKEIGSTGQREKFGVVMDDFLADWKTTHAKVKTVDRMVKNSPLIGGALRLAIEMSIRKVDWFFTSEIGPDDPDLELVQEAFDNLTHSWADFISDAVLSAFYGWTTFSKKFERKDGRLLWRKFKFLGHETHMGWIYDEDGSLLALEQYPHLWPEPIPIERLLLIRFRHAGGNPEGESILRPAWVPFYYGSNLEEIRAIGYERHAAGMPMVEMPMGADGDEGSNDHNKAMAIARNIRVDEQGGLVIPPPSGEGDHYKWRVSLMSAGNAQVFMALNTTISDYDQKVLLAALAQFTILGINGVGTQAKAESDVSFFTMAVDAFADTIAETFTKHAVDQLLRLNGREPGNIKLEHSPAGDVDATMMIEFIKAVGGRMNWTPQDEMQIRSIFGMPEKTEEELEALQEEADQRAEEQRQMMQQALARGGQNNQNGNQPPNNQQPQRDDNAVTVFMANNAPDDAERRKMERRWQRAASSYFNDALKRVERGARQIK
jgi:hypothetical protein